VSNKGEEKAANEFYSIELTSAHLQGSDGTSGQGGLSSWLPGDPWGLGSNHFSVDWLLTNHDPGQSLRKCIRIFFIHTG
jgi:hypothetical protein